MKNYHRRRQAANAERSRLRWACRADEAESGRGSGTTHYRQPVRRRPGATTAPPVRGARVATRTAVGVAGDGDGLPCEVAACQHHALKMVMMGCAPRPQPYYLPHPGRSRGTSDPTQEGAMGAVRDLRNQPNPSVPSLSGSAGWNRSCAPNERSMPLIRMRRVREPVSERSRRFFLQTGMHSTGRQGWRLQAPRAVRCA